MPVGDTFGKTRPSARHIRAAREFNKPIHYVGTRLLAGEWVRWGEQLEHSGRVLRVPDDATADVIEDGAPFRQWRLATRLLRRP